MKLFISLILFSICCNCAAQSFSNIVTFTTQNGLTNNYVTCLEKDEDGFLWIGTHEGLNQYDGTEFINILSNTKNNLPSNVINKICCINKTTLLIATQGGLSFLDTKTLEGKVIERPDGPTAGKEPLIAWDVLYDRTQKEIWVSAADGLYVLSAQGKVKRKIKAPKTTGIFSNYLFKDHFDHVFFYSAQLNGFFYPDFEKNQAIPIERVLPEFNLNKLSEKYMLRNATFENNKVICSFTSKDINNKKNLLAYYDNTGGNNFIDSFFVKYTNYYFLNLVFQVSDSALLINNFFGEPYLYNLHTHQVTPAAGHPLWFTSWPDGIGARLLVEKENIWVATSKALLQIPQHQSVFTTNDAVVDQIRTNRSLVSFNSGIWHNGKFWLSCLGSGVFAIDAAANKVQPLFNRPLPPALSKKVISDELIEAGSTLWFSSVYGPAQVNETTMRPTLVNAQNKDSLLDDEGKNPLKDSKGNIWFSLPDGITVYSPATGAFTSYKNTAAGGPFPIRRSLYKTEDGSGNIWFARQDTLVKFNPATQKFTLQYLKKDGLPLKGLQWLASDGKDLLYMYIKDAFAIYHISTAGIEMFTKQTGIVSTSINAMVTDKKGNPWIATEGGLVYYDSQLKRFYSYTKADGLPDNNILAINFTGSAKTELFLGFSNSYCLFDPQKLLQKKNEAIRNTITGVEVSGQAIAIDEEKTFSYQDNSISFFYTGINFTGGPQNSYAYMLEGIDKTWKYSEKKRQCSYINLPPGDYTFKIKSANQQGEWNETPATFTFKIAAPFWQTLWFRLIIAALCIALIYAFVKQRDKNVAAKNKLQLQMSELRLQAVQSQMNPHFIFNSLNSIQNFIVQNNQIEAARYLSRFSKLIRRILDNSHHQFLKLDDIVETLKMYVELEAFRFNKEFTYSFTVADDDERIYDVTLPPMLLQPYVENAILHGLMPKEGSKHLQVSFYIKDDKLHCIIEDNGIGRQQKAAGSHISQGQKLTKGMLQSMKLARIEIEDLKDPAGNAAGTRVVIQAPVES